MNVENLVNAEFFPNKELFREKYPEIVLTENFADYTGQIIVVTWNIDNKIFLDVSASPPDIPKYKDEISVDFGIIYYDNKPLFTTEYNDVRCLDPNFKFDKFCLEYFEHTRAAIMFNYCWDEGNSFELKSDDISYLPPKIQELYLKMQLFRVV